jgi:hypothetical protein
MQRMQNLKAKRRWYQFSLRSALIITALVAIACSMLGSKIEQTRRERDTVKKIAECGGDAVYDYEEENLNEPYGPEWLRGILGENFFSEVVAAYRVQLDGEALKDVLETLPYVKELQICTPVKDSELANFAGLTQLESLEFLAVSGPSSDSAITELQRALPNCKINR